MWRLIFVSLCAALTGCTTLSSQLQGSLQPPSGYAYAIVSLTGRAFYPDSASLQANWQEVGHPANSGSVYAAFVTDTVFGEEGMSLAEGRLALLRLTPGHYEISDVWAQWNDQSGIIFDHQSKHFVLKKPFDVQAGETVYLGNIWVDMSNLPELQIRNEQKRDFGHIHRVWHVNDTSIIHTRILPGAVPVAGDDSGSGTDGPSYSIYPSAWSPTTNGPFSLRPFSEPIGRVPR